MVKHKKKNSKAEIQKTAVDHVFEKRRKVKEKFDFMKAKPRIFLCAVLIGFLCIIGLLLMLPSAKVKRVRVDGNDYLSDEYVEKLSGISQVDYFYFIRSSQIEKRIESSLMVQDAKVYLRKNNVVEIVIQEETPIAYRYLKEPELILKNGSVISLKSEYLSMISRIPYLNGFETDEQLLNLVRAFRDIDKEMIESISEIHRFPLSYDEETIELLMLDGNYFFSSYFSLPVLNSYHKIVSEISEKGVCIFADDGMTVAYTSECPWNLIVEEKEYWIDGLGNIMENEYGDPIEKKYYRNKNGEYILDSEGNRIVVPLGADENDLSVFDKEEN